MAKIVLYSDESVKDYEELERKQDNSNNLIYVKEPNSFSSHKPVEHVSQSDLQQVRDWKNKVVEIRDRHKGSELYVTWDLELKRIVEFLLKFTE